MSYSLRNDHLKSHLTGREYAFERDRDGSSKRNATRQLEADDLAFTRANNERAMQTIGRPLTMRELHSGNWLPDSRPTAQKIAEDTVHISQAAKDPDSNPFASHLAALKAQQARDKRLHLQGRIDVLQAKHDEWEQHRAGEREHDATMNDPSVGLWLSDANVNLALLEIRSDVPQEWVERARARRDRLKESGDYETYKRDTFEWEAERDAAKKAKAAELDEKARELRAQAKAVRDDETQQPAE